MPTSELEFTAPDLFAAPLTNGQGLPRVFGAAARYVQGPGVFGQAGHYARRLGMSRCGIIASSRSLSAEGGILVDSFAAADISAVPVPFGGECSRIEIERLVDQFRQADAVDGIIAIGGGKVMDAGRAVAHRLGKPVIVAPTLASSDAPGASLSVIYTEDGVTEDAEVYDFNPALVIVDTQIIAQTAPRYLAAGIADALATWYEARSTRQAPMGVTVFGSAPTRTGTVIARAAAEIIYDQAHAAMAAVERKVPDEALEDVVEANTLLSSLGVENGGLSLAHAVAQGLTLVDQVHAQFLHGEMVSFGILTHLMAEGDAAEAEKSARFLNGLGLPITLNDIGLTADHPALDAVVAGAMAFPFLGNRAEPIDARGVRAALLAADAIGRQAKG